MTKTEYKDKKKQNHSKLFLQKIFIYQKFS